MVKYMKTRTRTSFPYSCNLEEINLLLMRDYPSRLRKKVTI